MKKSGRTLIVGFMCISIFVAFEQPAYAQLEVSIGVGSLTMNINQINAPESGGTVVFPREYSVYGSMGCVYGGGFVIASKNFKTKWFYNPAIGRWASAKQDTLIPYFVAEASTKYYTDLTYSTVPVPDGMARYWKYKSPLRIVDSENFSDPNWQVYDRVGGPDMISEHMVVATCNTACGITLTQRAYAFGDPQYDDFIIVEYVFKNTGNIDGDPEPEYANNQVHQCYIGLSFVPQPSGLTQRIIAGAGGWNAQLDDWLDYYAGEYNGEAIRLMYGWDGDAAVSFYPADDEGDPLPASGIFMSPQYPGMAILHADKAVDDHSNDPVQPLMSYYSFGGAFSTNAFSIGGSGIGAEAIHKALSTPAFFTGPFDWQAWNSTQSEVWAVDNNPNREHYKTGTVGFGPYEFNSLGDSVRIVVCYTVGSLGWANAVEFGRKWKNQEISQTVKNKWLRSGRDSLLAKVSRVTRLFKNANGDFDLTKGAARIQDPPEPPGLILSTAVAGMDLEFTDVGAARYRVYRRLKPVFSLEDAPTELLKEPYPLIKELDPKELTRSGNGMLTWRDENVIPGVSYWYSVTAVNDRGLESSKFLSRTDPTSSDPTRGSVTAIREAATALDSVFVVPNPYHVKSERLYSLPTGIIKFVGLPAQCRIRIYTQSGYLVVTLHHQLRIPPSDVEEWDLLTESDQFVASGLYIYVVDQAKNSYGRDLGAVKVDKFVVIR